VIPNGCDVEAFDVDPGAGVAFRERFSWLGDRPLIVYTGTLGLVNGVSYLARLAKATLDRDPEIRFLIVGQGKEEQLVRSTAEQLGVLDRNFFMHEGISKVEMPALLAAADIATSTVIDVEELWANSANKFFDALAAGTPIAINHRGWQADLIEQTGAGLVFDARNIEAAAEKLICAVRRPGWLKTAGAAARQLGHAQFDRDRLAAQLDQVLRDAANRPEG
jgi:glycosyltransferase involved in cell wall biosynthesis